LINVPTLRRRFVVSGKVQGVFFREGAKSEAQRLGITGWASNLPNGAVEIVAEGEPNSLEMLGRWLKNGSARASVASVESSHEAPQGIAGFSIR
jgi:acylphosphatase